MLIRGALACLILYSSPLHRKIFRSCLRGPLDPQNTTNVSTRLPTPRGLPAFFWTHISRSLPTSTSTSCCRQLSTTGTTRRETASKWHLQASGRILYDSRLSFHTNTWVSDIVICTGDGTGQQSDGTKDLPVSNVTRFCRNIAHSETIEGKEIAQVVFYQVRIIFL